MRAPTGFLLILLTLSMTIGCGGYGEISPTAYEYAKAIYNIAGRKAESQVEPFCEQLKAARDAGQLSEKEAEWLLAIADKARLGDWKDASQAARRMMEDQVR